MREIIGEGFGSFPPGGERLGWGEVRPGRSTGPHPHPGPPPAREREPVGVPARCGPNTTGSVYHWMAALLGLCLMSCTALQPPPSSPSSFPFVGTLSAAERARIIQSRTTGVQTLTAVLAVSYTVGKQSGTFDMIVNYAAPGSVRFTALKDMLLSTQVFFDLLFTEETYRLLMRDDKGEQFSQGIVTQFAQAHPTFRTFFLAGEAFFLPGFDGQGQPSRVNAAGTHLTTRLRSGVRARWLSRPDTLEITQACLTWQAEEETVPLRLHYADYHHVGAYYIPYRVTVRDQRLGFTAQSVVKSVEINAPLAPGAFDFTP